jgi:hypothetical protein
MLHHAFQKLASYSPSCLIFCVSFYRSVPLFKCNYSSLIYDVSDVNAIVIILNSTRDHEFNRESDWFANIVRCDSTRHKATARLYLITVFDPAHCTIVTYVLPTCFDLCKVIIREVHTKAYKYRKSCQRYACTEIKSYALLIKIMKNV